MFIGPDQTERSRRDKERKIENLKQLEKVLCSKFEKMLILLSVFLHIIFCFTVKPVSSGHSSEQVTVKPLSNGHSKIDKTKILMTKGSLMKVKNMTECSPWSILQYF